jgi:hypothetical protein
MPTTGMPAPMLGSGNNSLAYMLDRLRPGNEPMLQGRLPNTDGVAGLPREVRKSADDMARFFRDNMQRALLLRRPHATSWMKVLSILSGIHYFHIDRMGMWRPLAKQNEQDIRAFVPVMVPKYRREHGRLSSNQIGITAAPITGRSANGMYEANLAQAAMTHWIEEAGMADCEDKANQELLTYGGYAYFAEKDPAKQQVLPVTFPYCDLLPIPYDARTWEEMDGVVRMTMVTESWLQHQDELYERRNGTKPPHPMSKMANSQEARPNSDWTGFGAGLDWYTKFKGCQAAWIWMKPTEANGFMGEHAFMIEEDLFAYVSGMGGDGRPICCGNGLPLYPVHYIKYRHDWWPQGFCEHLVAMQRETNRQWTNILQAAELNRGFVVYDQTCISGDAIQNSSSGLVGYDPPGPESKSEVIKNIPPASIGREFGAILEICDKFTDMAAGHESAILSGEHEGRVDGGPAVSTLNANAQAPLIPVLDRKFRALKRLYPDVLSGIREVWPRDKKIRVLGPHNLGKEIMIERTGLPSAESVVLEPTPLVINGRMGMLSTMLQLRQVVDEHGPLLTTQEFRRGLQMLGICPPGVEVNDKRETRILYRIGQLIGDGNTPQIAPAGQDPRASQLQAKEDHAVAVELLKDITLDPSFEMYGPAVQQALLTEQQFHEGLLAGVHPDNFDDAADRFDAQQGDAMLHAMENDNTSAGLYSPFGYPMGLAG